MTPPNQADKQDDNGECLAYKCYNRVNGGFCAEHRPYQPTAPDSPQAIDPDRKKFTVPTHDHKGVPNPTPPKQHSTVEELEEILKNAITRYVNLTKPVSLYHVVDKATHQIQQLITKAEERGRDDMRMVSVECEGDNCRFCLQNAKTMKELNINQPLMRTGSHFITKYELDRLTQLKTTLNTTKGKKS